MTNRPCSGCGLWRCEGECYFEEPSELTEVRSDPLGKYEPSPDYLMWLAEIDGKRVEHKRRRA